MKQPYRNLDNRPVMSGQRSMKLNSEKLGEIQYEEDEVVTFPEGLLGFPEKKRYVFVDHQQESPLKWLQCLDDSSLSFVVINPLLFKGDYQIQVDKKDLALLGNSDPGCITIWTLVSFSPDARKPARPTSLAPWRSTVRVVWEGSSSWTPRNTISDTRSFKEKTEISSLVSYRRTSLRKG